MLVTWSDAVASVIFGTQSSVAENFITLPVHDHLFSKQKPCRVTGIFPCVLGAAIPNFLYWNCSKVNPIQ